MAFSSLKNFRSRTCKMLRKINVIIRIAYTMRLRTSDRNCAVQQIDHARTKFDIHFSLCILPRYSLPGGKRRFTTSANPYSSPQKLSMPRLQSSFINNLLGRHFAGTFTRGALNWENSFSKICKPKPLSGANACCYSHLESWDNT